MHKTRWTALFLCLLVIIGVYNAAIAGDEDQPSQSEVRCYFEHTLLPEVFYSDPLTVIGGMDSDSLYRSWNMIAQDFGYADSYAESDFQAYRLQSEKDIIMALIILPAPTEARECYRLYLCYDMTAKAGFYFTNEYEEDMEGWGLVGLWTPEKEHHFVDFLEPLDVSSQEAFADSLQNEVDHIFNLVVMNRTSSLTE